MTAARPLRVSVVDDADIVVHGLASMVAPYADRVRVVGVASAADGDHDIALVDDPGGEGSTADIEAVRRELRAQHVVVWSWEPDPRRVEEALGRGASGYLAKMLPATDLVAALERIHRGETVVSEGRPAAAGDRAAESAGAADATPARPAGLTMRESEIITMITEGLSNQQIADRAYLSINSVKSYIRSSYRKMGVTSRSRAVLWGIEHGFRR